ncbi:hypothetical protein BD311DRAFT_783133, partial [Dichomitus squalens]
MTIEDPPWKKKSESLLICLFHPAMHVASRPAHLASPNCSPAQATAAETAPWSSPKKNVWGRRRRPRFVIRATP